MRHGIPLSLVGARHAVPLLVMLLGVACSPYGQTTRVFDGREVVGRPISSDAYAAFLSGALLEAKGKPKAAVAEYERALSYDSDSVEIQTALARAWCRFDPRGAEEAFAAALDMDADYSFAHEERARCALRHGRKGLALESAKRAQALSPFRYSVNEVLIDAFEKNGDLEAAQRYLLGYLALFPDDRRARARLGRLFPSTANSSAGVAPQRENTASDESAASNFSAATERIRAAIREGELDLAQDLALEHRVDRVTLGRLALAEGRPDFALRQGQLVLSAEPGNNDARVLVLWSATLLFDRRAYRGALHGRELSHEPPSPASAEELERLLGLVIGQHAAVAWREGYQRIQAELAMAESP